MLHSRARRVESRALALRDLNRRGVARVRRDWNALPPPREPLPESHPYAADLDVAGTHASLFRLLDVVSAAPGRPVLLAWLLAPPASAAELRERQRAVAELAPRVDLREELALLARRTAEVTPNDFERFLAWAEGDGWLRPRAGVRWAARIIPAVTIAAVVLALGRKLPWSVAGFAFVAGLLLLGRYRRPLRETLTSVLARASGLREQASMLATFAAAPVEAPLLVHLRERVAAGGGAQGALRRLERVLSMAEGEGSMLQAIAQAVLLWDFHVVDRESITCSPGEARWIRNLLFDVA